MLLRTLLHWWYSQLWLCAIQLQSLPRSDLAEDGQHGHHHRHLDCMSKTNLWNTHCLSERSDALQILQKRALATRTQQGAHKAKAGGGHRLYRPAAYCGTRPGGGASREGGGRASLRSEPLQLPPALQKEGKRLSPINFCLSPFYMWRGKKVASLNL